jgi:TolB protein
MIERYDFDVDRGTLAPEAHPVLTGPRNFIPQAVSPDGEWLATLLFEDEGRQDILLIRVRTGETRRLTDDALREDSLEWAPDGSKLYFSAAPGGAGEVWSIRPDGSGREREVASEGLVRITAPLASPDGRTLLVEVGPDIQPHLVDLGVPLAQRKLVPLPPLPTGKIFEAWAWSPDGRWIAGYSYSPVDGRRPPLYLFDTQRRTFEELADLKSTPLWPDWLPDSRRLLVRRGEKVEVLDRVTRTLKPAGSLRPDVQRVLLSRDGRSLFGTRWVVESDVWMLDYGAAP